jgi:hypothetical protein
LEEIYEFSANEWAQKTFGAVVLGDKRRTKRAVALAIALAQILLVPYRFKPVASVS